MGYEIEFLAVGEESKGGDAIAIRYGNLHGARSEQTVIVIDGGYAETGQKLVDHIRTYYKTNRVDIAVSTHPDQDHVSGLEVLVEQIEVGTLLMHQPWRHSSALSEAKARSFQRTAMSEKVEKSLKEASDLETIATNKGVDIVEPFRGVATTDGSFRILGPTKEYYEELLGEIQKGVTAQAASASGGLAELLGKAMKAAQKLISETLHKETLRDDGTTSPSNSTSAICMLTVDDHVALFTGDAGIEALSQVADVLEAEGFQPGTIDFFQVPHHGSRRNVGPTVLNRLLGQPGQANTHSTAFISAPAKNPESKHPAKKVSNAVLRRGYKVLATQGSTLRHHNNAPTRGWAKATPLPFYDQVEEDS